MSYVCDKSLPFYECELAILRNAVDEAEVVKGQKLAGSEEIKSIISIVENFIQKKKLICYGGTAINNILPAKDQFYDNTIEIPDYDFLSPNALEHAKELADIYYKLGYKEVEAKAGQHFGTYKVFVNFIPIADITQINETMYASLRRESIRISGIHYLPPNMLRMSMYLELSRPAGDISRWEKVLKRLTLLNKNYPLKSKKCNYDFFSRKMESIDHADEIFTITKKFFIKDEVVFFGGYASNVFSRYMQGKSKVNPNPDFDVLSMNAKDSADKLVQKLKEKGINNISILKHPNVDEYVPVHYEVKVGKDTISFIYQTIACYSFNEIFIDGEKVKVATIDTMLSMLLAFIYTNRKYYDTERILCMASFLFRIQQQNRLAQKGPLKRFNINCYGTQATKESIRAEKSEKYELLKDKRDSKEFELWFLNYKPFSDENTDNKNSRPIELTKKKKKIQKQTRKRVAKKKASKASIKRLLEPLIKLN